MELTTDHRSSLIERLNSSKEHLEEIASDLRTENYTDNEVKLLFEVDHAAQVAKINFIREKLHEMNVFM